MIFDHKKNTQIFSQVSERGMALEKFTFGV